MKKKRCIQGLKLKGKICMNRKVVEATERFQQIRTKNKSNENEKRKTS